MARSSAKARFPFSSSRQARRLKNRPRYLPTRFERLEQRVLLAANLIGHWSASDLNAQHADGDVIGSWTDTVNQVAAFGNGQPKLVKDAYKGQSVVRFDAADGTDLFTVAAETSPMSGAEDFTVALVFATSDRPLPDADQFWFGTGLVDATRQFGFSPSWGMNLNSAGQVGAGVGGPAVTVFSKQQGLNDGDVHVAVYTRSAGTLSLYVDGEPADQTSEASPTPRDKLAITFGAIPQTGGFPFTGDIAEIRFYDDNVSDTEAAALFEELMILYGNAAPKSQADHYTTEEDITLSVNALNGVLKNDSDLDGDPLLALLVDPPAHGTVELEPDGSFVYRPTDDFHGTDTFTYRTRDVKKESRLATVSIDITPIADAPRPSADSYWVAPTVATTISAANGLLANDLHPEGLPSVVVLENNVQHGTLTLHEDGSFTYQPDAGYVGHDEFSYGLDDGELQSTTSRVDLEVSAAPVVISEFMAVNETVLASRTRRSPTDEFDGSDLFFDWIELANLTNTPFDVGHMHLTDRENRPRKWQFPADTLIPASGRLVVFASGLDITDPSLDETGTLHTNFRLSAGGEYLALTSTTGSTLMNYVDVPVQFSDVAYGSLDGSSTVYFTSPTPGAPNSTKVVRRILNTQHTILDPKGISTTAYLSEHATVNYVIPNPTTGPAMYDLWTHPAYEQGSQGESWRSTDSAIGFDDDQKFADQFTTDVATEMIGQNGSAYLRYTFDVPDPRAINSLTLRTKYDDGFLAYLNGQLIARRNAPGAIEVNNNAELVHAWQFEGSTVDTSGSGNHGHFFGTNETYVNGKVGRAISLEAGEFVRHTKANRLPTTSREPWSINLWARYREPPGNGDLLAGFGDMSRRLRRSGRGLMQQDGNITFWRNVNNEPTSTVFPNDDAWHMYTVTFDGRQLNMFLDSNKIFSKNLSSQRRTQPIVTVGGVTEALGEGFNGVIDEFTVWSGVLTQEDIHHLLSSAESASPQWDWSAVTMNDDSAAPRFEEIDVYIHAKALRETHNVLAIQALNRAVDDTDFLFTAEIVGTSGSETVGTVRVETTVAPDYGDLDSVTLHYRTMFDAEQKMLMVDNGTSGDLAANDGIYTASVPAGTKQSGQMFRYYVTATRSDGTRVRNPLFLDREGQNQSPEYFGTVFGDAERTTDLSVLEWFVEDETNAERPNGTRASLYTNEQFYDNVFVRQRGHIAASWPKKSFKFDANPGWLIKISPDQPAVEEINLNTTYADKSYVRAPMAFQAHTDAGVPSPDAFVVHVRRNGEFHSLANYIEQVDERFLDRVRLNPNGSLYKFADNFIGGIKTIRGGYKQTRFHEDKADLAALVEGLNPNNPQLVEFVYDNLDLPTIINYMAMQQVLFDADYTEKNFYLYRDTMGSGEWLFIPWDKDLTFGIDIVATLDDLLGADDDNEPAGTDAMPAHPFYGAEGYSASPNPAHMTSNRIIDAIIQTPATREMYLRRLRTVMDQYLGAPGIPRETAYFETRFDDWERRLLPDAALDKSIWATPWPWGLDHTVTEAIDNITEDYLPRRRVHLFSNHSVDNLGFPRNAGIPNPEPTTPDLRFETLDFDPVSGNQAEEYVEIVNASDFATDISGWQITGSIDFTFKPGTVIPAGGSLYVSPDVSDFRMRSAEPSGKQQRFVVGGYAHHLPNTGGTFELVTDGGNVINSKSYRGTQPSIAAHLRISELHYHPADPTMAEAAAGFDDADDFEFIELVNIGEQPITLADARLSKVVIDTREQGVLFNFLDSPIQRLGPGERVIVVDNLSAFETRYGSDLPVAGQWRGGLSNRSETVTLTVGTELIQQFTYSDQWHPETDGRGASLEIADANDSNLGRWSLATGWRTSIKPGGSPGRAGESSEVRADFDGDGVVSAHDIDLLFAAAAAETPETVFDLTGDGVVDRSDADELVFNVLGTHYGDSNLDGRFDQADLELVFQAGKYSDHVPNNSTWATGDWNGDGEFNSEDFVKAFSKGGFSV